MKVAYLRISKGLPTEAEQRAALLAAGVSPEEMADAWVDRRTRKLRPGENPTPQRGYLLQAIREGDEVWIARPAVAAQTETEGLDFLRELTECGAVLCVASTGGRHRWSADVLDALSWVKEARADARGLVMAQARAGRAAGRKTFSPQQWKTAREVWADPDQPAAKAEEASGIGVRTIYRRLGPKNTPTFGRKK